MSSDLAEEAAIGRHVGDAGLDQIVEAAGHHVAFEDLRRPAHGGGELLEHVRRRLVEGDLDEDQELEPEPARIELRAEAGDVALPLQPLQALAGRGRRQADALGEVDRRDAALRLQNDEDAPVGAVDVRRYSRSFVELP